MNNTREWVVRQLLKQFTGVVARVVVEPSRDIESLRGRMSPSGIISEGERQVEGLFESLLSEVFS